MAYTQTQIDALKKAIALGATEVDYGTEKVTFRSLKDMRSILADMEAEVNGSGSRPGGTQVAQFRPGHY